MSDAGSGTVYDSLQLTFDGNDGDWVVPYIAYGIPNLVLLAFVFALVWLQTSKQRAFWDVPGWLLSKFKSPLAWFYLSALYFTAWVALGVLIVVR